MMSMQLINGRMHGMEAIWFNIDVDERLLGGYRAVLVSKYK
jgi:hypothetical protein